MKYILTFLILELISLGQLHAQKIENSVGYNFILSKPIDIDLDKNNISQIRKDEEDKIYALRISRSSNECELLKFDSSFNLLAKAPNILTQKQGSDKIKMVCKTFTKDNIYSIYYKNENQDNKLTLLLEILDKNLKATNESVELNSFPFTIKNYQNIYNKGHGFIKITRSPDDSKVLITLYHTPPKDEDKAIHYLLVDIPSRKSYTKTFKWQVTDSALHLGNTIDNNGVAHILTGTTKDNGLNFKSYLDANLGNEKIANFSDLALLNYNFLSNESHIMPLELPNMQYFRFDMFTDVKSEIIITGFCTKGVKREKDNVFYIRYAPSIEKIIIKKVNQLSFKVPPLIIPYSTLNPRTPSYVETLTHRNDLTKITNGSCMFLFQGVDDYGNFNFSSRKNESSFELKDITVFKLDSIGNLEWQTKIPYSRMVTGLLTPSTFLNAFETNNNQIIYVYEDAVKNKEIYESKKLTTVGLGVKTIPMYLTFDAKGSILKGELKIEANKKQLGYFDLVYGKSSPFENYIIIEEGKKMIIGKLTFFVK
jgi:hypothetical protein